MMNTEDDWVAAALTDDTLVAELLCRLAQSSSRSPPPPPPPNPCLQLPCAWGQRQRRSKPRKESSGAMTVTRRSPTTPLSWSDGDYSNSTSSRPPSDLSRSNKGRSSSSSKKKKSFSELKEEERLLLRERVGLKREMASLNSSLNQQRVKSARLNRIKMDLTATSCRSTHPRQDEEHTEKGLREVVNEKKGFFPLPDLNMMPSEEEIS